MTACITADNRFERSGGISTMECPQCAASGTDDRHRFPALQPAQSRATGADRCGPAVLGLQVAGVPALPDPRLAR